MVNLLMHMLTCTFVNCEAAEVPISGIACFSLQVIQNIETCYLLFHNEC